MQIYPLIKPLLFTLPPETAHRLAVKALAYRLIPPQPDTPYPSLAVNVSGLHFNHSVCLAAGFDKNAEATAPLFKQGFAAVECGTVTLKPQAGNKKPRLFRLEEDEAIINRMGFNNNGAEALRKRLSHHESALAQAKAAGGIVGINIGKNKDSEDAAADYAALLEIAEHYADYITVNISSPNTPGLRDLQSGKLLQELLETIAAARQKLPRFVPIWLKLAPDLSEEECRAAALLAKEYAIDALIIGNTTVSRDMALKSKYQIQQGGLSGKPLALLSTQKLALFYRLTDGKIPLIGVGGIASAEDAYARIRAGASLIQLYSALIYQGFDLVTAIKSGLANLLARDGFATLSEAIGKDVS